MDKVGTTNLAYIYLSQHTYTHTHSLTHTCLLGECFLTTARYIGTRYIFLTPHIDKPSHPNHPPLHQLSRLHYSKHSHYYYHYSTNATRHHTILPPAASLRINIRLSSSMLDNIHNLTIYIPSIFYTSSDSEDDTMPSPTAESRRVGMQRRDSSRSNSGGRRPRLVRSSATEPSITASTASRNALANPQSSRRATDLLNQIAISGSPPNSASPLSQSPTMYDSPESMSMSLSMSMSRDEHVHHIDIDGFRPHLGMSSYTTLP